MQCPVLAVALYVAVAQFYDVEARLALARSLDLGWASSPGASSRAAVWPSMPPRAGWGSVAGPASCIAHPDFNEALVTIVETNRSEVMNLHAIEQRSLTGRLKFDFPR